MNEINKCFQILQDNMLTVAKNTDVLFETADFNEWSKKLTIRSKALREIYIQNEEALKRLNEIASHLTEETAEDILQEIKNLNIHKFNDPNIMIVFCEKLLEYYSDGNHKKQEIFLNSNLCYEKMEYYLRMDVNEVQDEIRNHIQSILKYVDSYNEIEPLDVRRTFYIAFYNLVGPLPDLIPEWKKDQIQYFKMAMNLYNSEATKMDKNEELILNEIDYLKEIMLFDFGSYMDETKEKQREYFSIVDSFIEEFEDEKYEVTLYSIVKKYCCNELNADDALKTLLDIYKENYQAGLIYDGTDESIFEFGNMSDLAFSIFAFLKKSTITYEEKKAIAHTIFKPISDYISGVSFKDYSSYFDDVFAEMFTSLLPYAGSLKEKEELLLKLVIKRQPLTYIHSLMVERISATILDEILKYSESLRGQFYSIGFASDAEIKDYISRAAKIHDLGKCLTVGVINQQSRRLTDLEFRYIKLHPEKALVLIKGDTDFIPYYDVMLGHHRYYDGSGGYPLSFDILNSKYKIAIDLITISDCLDAATDILGRNYTTGKDFNTVLTEFERDKGIRYNPEIVDFISQNENLRERLDSLVSTGRKQVYYKAFKGIVDQNS